MSAKNRLKESERLNDQPAETDKEAIRPQKQLFAKIYDRRVKMAIHHPRLMSMIPTFIIVLAPSASVGSDGCVLLFSGPIQSRNVRNSPMVLVSSANLAAPSRRPSPARAPLTVEFYLLECKFLNKRYHLSRSPPSPSVHPFSPQIRMT